MNVNLKKKLKKYKVNKNNKKKKNIGYAKNFLLGLKVGNDYDFYLFLIKMISGKDKIKVSALNLLNSNNSNTKALLLKD